MRKGLARFVRRLYGDFSFRTLLFLYGGAVFNCMYAGLYILFSVLHESEMLVVFSLYYTVLAINRVFLIRSLWLWDKGERIHPWRVFRQSGVFILALGLSLAPLSAFLLIKNRRRLSSPLLFFASLIYALFVLFLSFRGSLRHRQEGNPILSAAKNVSLSGAIVSLLSLSSALRLAPTLLGFFSVAATLSLGAFMIFHGKRKINEKRVYNSEKNG